MCGGLWLDISMCWFCQSITICFSEQDEDALTMCQNIGHFRLQRLIKTINNVHQNVITSKLSHFDAKKLNKQRKRRIVNTYCEYCTFVLALQRQNLRCVYLCLWNEIDNRADTNDKSMVDRGKLLSMCYPCSHFYGDVVVG